MRNSKDEKGETVKEWLRPFGQFRLVGEHRPIVYFRPYLPLLINVLCLLRLAFLSYSISPSTSYFAKIAKRTIACYKFLIIFSRSHAF